MNVQRSFFPQSARDAHVAEIDRMLQQAYTAGIRAAYDAAATVGLGDVEAPRFDDPTKDAYWRGRHESRDAITRLLNEEKA